MAKSDYYDVLGVSKSVSADELKKAYRKQALQWHPDRHTGIDKEEAEQKFKEINEAYQILSDPQKKQAYDQFGHDAFAPGGGFRGASGGNPFAGQGGQYGPFTYYYSSNGGGSSGSNPFGGADFGDPFDIFEQFFGFGSPFGRSQQKQVPRYSITIDFMEAMEGVTKDVSIGGKKRTIKIPPGVDNGSRIKFEDFILSISVKPDKIFERDGDDVYVKVVIPYSLAALGGAVDIPTIWGDVKLKVRPGTQPGTMMRLREKGAPRLHARGKGDEYVRFNIEVPERLTREQKRVLEDMGEEGL